MRVTAVVVAWNPGADRIDRCLRALREQDYDDLEVVVGTVSSGVVAYELPNSANARVLWGTGRGSYRRTGTPPPSP